MRAFNNMFSMYLEGDEFIKEYEAIRLERDIIRAIVDVRTS